jgi:glycine dehydrogenase
MSSGFSGLPSATASLLDEGSAAAAARALTLAVAPATETPVYLIEAGCHPQTIEVVATRAEARGVQTLVQAPT